MINYLSKFDKNNHRIPLIHDSFASSTFIQNDIERERFESIALSCIEFALKFNPFSIHKINYDTYRTLAEMLEISSKSEMSIPMQTERMQKSRKSFHQNQN